MKPSSLPPAIAVSGLAQHRQPMMAAAEGASAGVKIVFANQLRALAALSVMLSHWGGVYVLMGSVVSWITSTPPVAVGRPAILHVTMLPGFNFGGFGVAVFFLISGFVIPFSLRAHRARAFLVARALRIYPTLWAALLVEWLCVFAQSHLYGRAMAYRVASYLYNASLLETLTDGGYVDLVNWTLAVEVKFYILMALLRPWILAGRTLPLFGWSVLALGVGVAQRHGLLHCGAVLANEPMSIGFMLIGTVFHYRLAGQIGAAKALCAGGGLLGLFVLCWREGANGGLYPDVQAAYVYGLVLFAAAFAARRWFRPFGLLDRLADISYPLYLIHSIIGYSVMTFAIVRLGFGYAAAVAVALAVVLPLAWLLHRLVERPSLRLGKQWARSLSAPRRA